MKRNETPTIPAPKMPVSEQELALRNMTTWEARLLNLQAETGIRVQQSAAR